MQILHILIYSCLLFSLLLLLTVDAKQADLVPGCADLNAIAKADSYNGSFCFCSVPDGGSNVHISCLYSSTLEQFRRAFLAVTAAKKAVQQVTLNRVEFEAAILPGKIFDSPYASIQIISIDKCSQNAPLNIHDDSFHGLAEHLEELYITGCNLEQFPRAAIRNLTKLRTLSLAYNKLTNLRRMDFEPLKRLEILNLEGNFISSLENGTLLALRNSLKKLSFGNHNFVGDSIFDEISQLSELQVLDMDRADGITDIAQGTFERMNKLEKLLLPGCSLTIIHRNTFRGLTKLTELDLRINLLNEVECGSFTWTPNLRRLSLAGNYLNESFACWWDGLEHLKELDLGWNEFLSLENNAFSKLGQTLALLNLRHNTRLVQELDLSSGKLQLIDDSDLQAQTENLQRLILRNNQLTTLSRNILENMKNLQVLDLSDNQWLCDENMEAVVEEIELKYKEAVLTDQKFILLHANETSCDYPHNLKGQIIMNVIKELFKSNNYSEDIIYSSTPMIPIMDNGINLEDINTSVFTELLAKGTLIGDENTKIEHHLNTSSTVRPLYHVNMKTELINEHMKINPAPVIIVAITLILVSTAVIVAVARHLRIRNQLDN
uniref:Leucine-rich repeat-containing N-terminal plant-type domain-containing protein n=1 Tax=Setaria digitata TaxID=48799 RepID=A0A915PZU5_9BILA